MDPSFQGMMAPTPQKTAGSPRSRLIKLVISCVVALILLCIGIFIFSALTAGPREDSARLTYRLESLSKLVADAQNSISDDTLSKANTEVGSVLLSDIATLTPLLPKKATDTLGKRLLKEEAITSVQSELTAAKQRSQFDQTYRTTLSEKINDTLALAESIKTATAKKSVQTALSALISHLETNKTALAQH